MKKQLLALAGILCLSLLTQYNLNAQTGTWTAVANPAPNQNMGVMLLMTDGTVICHNATGGAYGTGWDKLTPNAQGSYVNGTWSVAASMINDRLFFSTQVLQNGNVYAAGGEYGNGAYHSEVYNPIGNTWTASGNPPGGWNIYDGNSEILANGDVLEGPQIGANPSFDCLYWNHVSGAYTIAPSSSVPNNCNHDEAAWLKLPDNSILFVGRASTRSTRYIPSLATWVTDATVPVNLWDGADEAGSAFMLPNGKAIFLGALGHNAIYTPSGNNTPGTWAVAADFPVLGGNQMVPNDASAAMMVNGHILCAVSPIGNPVNPSEFNNPIYFVEYNYLTNTFAQVTSPIPGLGGADSIAFASCYQTCMLDLPDGTVLLGVNQAGSFSQQYFVYTPGSGAIAQGKPTVNSVYQTPGNCGFYFISGKLFNGISEGAAYGDDWQMETNYPLVRLQNGSNVYYCRTSMWNRIGAVQTDSLQDTARFTLPPALPCGTYTLVAVVNGFESNPVIFNTYCISASVLTEVHCKGSSTGSASATVTGGTPAYTYNWTPSGGTAATATGLSAGTYTITVTDKNGCIVSASVTVTQPATVLTATATATPSSCSGNTGTASVTAAGGNSPYTYLWAPLGGTNSLATGLSAATYTVNVTDANGCTVTASATVTNSGGPTVIASSTGVSCFGGNNGKASCTASAGTPPYTYLWSPGGGTTASITGLTAGSYTITVKDNTGCMAIAVTSVTQPPQLTVAAGNTGVKCFGGNTGTVSSTAGGGTGAYTYLWSPGGGTNAGMTGLSTGTYTITVTDANSCTATAATTVTQPASALSVTISGIVNVKCNGSATGSATASASGGTPAYTYNWTPGGNTNATATGLTAGAYTVTVTDNNGCTATASATLTQPTALSAVTSTTPSSCSGSTGTASVTASGGTGAYTYSWAPSGGTNALATSLSPGNYTVTVTDANGCTHTALAVVGNLGGLTVSISSSSNISCFGGSNGSATANPSGGTLPYTYNWAPSGGTNATATGLTAASYTVTVHDKNGCVGTASVLLTQPATALSVTTGGIINVKCKGSATGSATANPAGGTPAYTYNWTPGGNTNAGATGLTAGTYTVTLTDSHGCTATATATITQPATALSAITSTTPSSCSGSTGTASVTASGGTGAYTYNWSPSGGTTTLATGLSAGNYTVSVTDANGCNVTAGATVGNAGGLTVTISGVTNVTCNGGSNGSATANAAAGTPPYTYNWIPSGGTNATATGLSAGSYTVTAMDRNGCSATAMTTITQPPPMTVTPVAPVICSGNSVVLTANGAGSYTWSPAYGLSPITGPVVTASPSVTTLYTVTGITGGCVNTATVVVTVNPTPVITLVPPSANLCSGDSVVITAHGAMSYTWAPPTGLSNTVGLVVTAFPKVTTTYTVTGNSNGCSATQTITVTVNPTPTVTVNPANPAPSCSGDSVALTAGGASSYLWSPATGLSSITGSSVKAAPPVTTSYTVTGTTGSCSNSVSVVVTVNPTPTVTVTPASASICTGGAGTGLTASGAASYTWAPAAGLSAITGSSVVANPVVTTTYTVTGTTGSCSATQTVTITVNNTPTVTVTPSPASVCSGDSVTLTASGAGSYSWAPPTGLSAITGSTVKASPAATTSYTVTGTNGSCTGNAVVVVTVHPKPAVMVIPPSAKICAGAPGITLDASGASTYAWAPPAGLSSLTGPVTVAAPASTTTYTVTGTGSDGCTNTATVTITVDSAVNASISGKDTICPGDSTTLTASGGGTYSWSTGSTNVSVTVKPAVSTQYTVTVTKGSCSATAVQLVIIKDCSMGIDELTTGGGVNVYPNPTTGEIRVDCNIQEGDYIFRLTDILGQVVWSEMRHVSGQYTCNFSLNNYSSGIYVLSIEGNNLTARKKIMLNK